MEPWLLEKYKGMFVGQSLCCEKLESHIHKYANCWLVLPDTPTVANIGRIVETEEQLTLLLNNRQWRVGRPLTDLLK